MNGCCGRAVIPLFPIAIGTEGSSGDADGGVTPLPIGRAHSFIPSKV
jgi:hypothetical protein